MLNSVPVDKRNNTNPCGAWGSRARLGDETWTVPVLAQVADMRLDETTFTQVVAALASNERPVSLDKARLERQIKILANQNVEGTLDDDAYVGRERELKR